VSDWAPGYHWSDLHRAQERFELRFPPDLVELLIEKRPVRGYDWTGNGEPIRKALAWPLEGLLFDVEHNGLWLSEWGDRSKQLADRKAAVTDLVAAAPKLIPLYGHRYLPDEPHERDNPILSVHQADVIHYGYDLADYFARGVQRSTGVAARACA
jgi:hypothetical protein